MCVHSSERVKQIKTVDVDNTALLKLIIIFLKLWYTIIKNMEKTGIFSKETIFCCTYLQAAQYRYIHIHHTYYT